jgi:uncharacterized protein (DUF2267 family)
MDELVKMVASKVGITEKQAQQAVEMVISALKEKLPGPVASQVEAVLKGDMGGAEGLAGGLGGLLGKK